MKFILGLLVFLTQNAKGDIPLLLKGEIGSVYFSQKTVEINAYKLKTESTKLYPPHKECNNTMYVRTQIGFGFLFYEPNDITYPAQSPWFDHEIKWQPYSLSTYNRCTWNEELISKDISQRFSDLLKINKFLILDSLSADGSAIQSTMLYQGQGLSSLTTSGKSEIKVKFEMKLSACQLEDGSWVTTFLNKDKETDLRHIISRLRERSKRQFVRCDFDIKGLRLIGEVAKGGSLATNSDIYGSEMTVLGDDHRLFRSLKNKLLEEYLPQNQNQDPVAESTAMEAAKSFVRFIVDDYGDLLYDLSEKKNVSEAEKKEAIRAFFDRHGSKIQGWFKIIDENYGAVTLKNKISMLISIQDMYATVSSIEQTVSRSNINLDRIIRSYQ